MPNSTLVREANTILPPQAATIFKQQTIDKKVESAYHVLWQDKHRGNSASPASVQPASHTNGARFAGTDISCRRSQNGYADQKSTQALTVRFKPIEKEQLRHIAQSEGVSLSQTVRILALRGMQTRIDMQYASFLEPAIERSITRHLNNRDSRIISLLIRIAYDSGQTRAIATNILGLQPDISPDLLRDIIAESNKTAKSNITKKTPQITELNEALEKWFFEQSRKDPLN